MRLFLVILLIVFSFFIRIYNLSSVPPILQEKEIRVGLAALNNNFNVAEIAPLSIAATIPFVKILGLSAYSVRLPSVVFAVISIVILFFIIRKKFPEVSILAVIFLTLSPFFIQISRIDTGINLGLCLFLLSVYLSLYIPKYPKIIFPAVIMFSLSVYADYSFFLPSLVAFTLVIFFVRKIIPRNFILIGSGYLLLILLILPIAAKSISFITQIDNTKEYLILQNNQISRNRISYSLGSRLSKILYNPYVEDVKLDLKNITQYLEPHQLFFTWTYNPNYTTSNSGLFYPFDVLFFIAGIIYFIKKDRRLLYIFSAWVDHTQKLYWNL